MNKVTATELNNKESDAINSAGSSLIYALDKEREVVREALKNEEIKSKTLDFIFGRSDENPLAEIRASV